MATASKAAPRTKKAVGPRSKAAVQGEGDYVSARVYNDRTRAFVKRMAAGKLAGPKGPGPSRAEMQAAEKVALSRSRGLAGDKADARLMRNNVAATGTKSRGRG